MHFGLVQQVVAPVLHRWKLALLDELPHADGSNLKNFSRSIGRNEFHKLESMVANALRLVNDGSIR